MVNLCWYEHKIDQWLTLSTEHHRKFGVASEYVDSVRSDFVKWVLLPLCLCILPLLLLLFSCSLPVIKLFCTGASLMSTTWSVATVFGPCTGFLINQILRTKLSILIFLIRLWWVASNESRARAVEGINMWSWQTDDKSIWFQSHTKSTCRIFQKK